MNKGLSHLPKKFRVARKKRFSVLLAYPDHIVEGNDVETYYDHVHARSKEDAVKVAQQRAKIANNLDDEDACDMQELLVLSGFHHGL